MPANVTAREKEELKSVASLLFMGDRPEIATRLLRIVGIESQAEIAGVKALLREDVDVNEASSALNRTVEILKNLRNGRETERAKWGKIDEDLRQAIEETETLAGGVKTLSDLSDVGIEYVVPR